jgi:hypothetical protein
MTGLPCGPKAALSVKGSFPKEVIRCGCHLGRVISGTTQKAISDLLFAGNVQLNSALRSLVAVAEEVLLLDRWRCSRTVPRMDTGGGTLAHNVLNRCLSDAYKSGSELTTLRLRAQRLEDGGASVVAFGPRARLLIARGALALDLEQSALGLVEAEAELGGEEQGYASEPSKSLCRAGEGPALGRRVPSIIEHPSHRDTAGADRKESLITTTGAAAIFVELNVALQLSQGQDRSRPRAAQRRQAPDRRHAARHILAEARDGG